MSNLKQMLDMCGNIEKAKKFANKLIHEENIKDVWLDLSLLYSTEGNYNKAIECLNEIKDCPPYKYHYVYCMGYYEMLLNHDLFNGFSDMNSGRLSELWGNTLIETTNEMMTFQTQISETKNTNVLIQMEAGIGDQIVFVRFIKELKEKYQFDKCYILTDENNNELFASLDFIDGWVTFVDDAKFDHWIPSMFLPVLLKTTFDDLSGVKYIESNKSFSEKYNYISKSHKKNIGIRWLGQPGNDYITRVFDPSLLFNLSDQYKDRYDFYSIQRDDYNHSIIPDHIVDMQHKMTTWNDTMGIIDNLDIVITSCTSVAHLSAAMGKETWVIIPKTPYYTWIDKEGFTGKTPWYDSITLFQQEKYGEWEDVFEKIKLKLDDF